MRRSRWLPLTRLVVVIAVAVGTVGCGQGSAAPVSTPTSESVDEVCESSAVLSCSWDVDGALHVGVGADAPDDAVVALALETQEAAEADALDVIALVEREAPDLPELQSEYTLPPAWAVQVYPGSQAGVETVLTDALLVERQDGVLWQHITDGWPSVTVDDAEAMHEVFDVASATALFADGGSYAVLAEDRLRIEHTPRWFSDEGVHAVIDVAVQHPDAEVLLEAEAGGALAPALYVAALTPEQVAALDESLSDPGVADYSIDGGAIEYTLGTLGSDGVTYTYGTIGGR